jgi:hypothetical protein
LEWEKDWKEKKSRPPCKIKDRQNYIDPIAVAERICSNLCKVSAARTGFVIRVSNSAEECTEVFKKSFPEELCPPKEALQGTGLNTLPSTTTSQCPTCS